MHFPYKDIGGMGKGVIAKRKEISAGKKGKNRG